MKKSILLPVIMWLLTFSTSVSFAQVPDWIWAKSAGGINSEGGNCVAIDASGNAYVTGYFLSPVLTFGSYTLTNAGKDDVFLVKYDAGGNVMWAKSAGGTDFDLSGSVAVDASGDAYITGEYTSSTLAFGSYTLTNAGINSSDLFLAKYDSGGNVQWATGTGGTDYDNGNYVSLDASGNAFVTGMFTSPFIIFGSDTLINVNSGYTDIFLAKIESGSGLGINEAHNAGISVYPNPATGKISIRTSKTSYNSTLYLLNLAGQQLLQKEIMTPITNIDVSALPNGVYVVKVIGEKEVFISKFIKQ